MCWAKHWRREIDSERERGHLHDLHPKETWETENPKKEDQQCIRACFQRPQRTRHPRDLTTALSLTLPSLHQPHRSHSQIIRGIKLMKSSFNHTRVTPIERSRFHSRTSNESPAKGIPSRSPRAESDVKFSDPIPCCATYPSPLSHNDGWHRGVC